MSTQAAALALALTDGSPFAIAFRDTVLALDALTAAEMNGKLYNDISDPITAMQVLVAIEAPVRQLIKAVLA